MSEQDSEVIKSMAIVTAAIALIGIIAFFIAQNVGVTKQTPVKKRAEMAVNERIAKVGTSKTMDAMPAKDAAPKVARSGAAVVAASCQACHSGGIPNAPKIGSKADWETRAALGIDAMTAVVVTGKGIMPPRGGGDFTDAEIAAAIQDMMSNSGL